MEIFRSQKNRVVNTITRGQGRIINSANNNTVIFVAGPAGTGKTYVTVAYGLDKLQTNKIDSLVLTRPAVQCGTDLGSLPGELHEKIGPYMAPFVNKVSDILSPEEHTALKEAQKVRYEPLGFLRGQTLDNCVVILDEAQNASEAQIKMLITRLGPKAQLFITGDPEQTDLRRASMKASMDRLQHINDISTVHLSHKDIVRHQVVKDVIQAYRQ